MVLTRSRVWCGAILGAAVVIIALAIEAGVGAASGQSSRFGQSGPVSQVRMVQADQLRHFAVFRRARGAADTIPPSLGHLLGESDVTGKNLALARRFDTADGPGWAIPGNGAVCLALPDRLADVAVACSSTEDAALRGSIAMMIGADDPSRVLVGMIVPGAASVAATFRDGRTRALDVAGGIVSTVLTGAKTITLTTESGDATSYVVPTPPPVPQPPRGS